MCSGDKFYNATLRVRAYCQYACNGLYFFVIIEQDCWYPRAPRSDFRCVNPSNAYQPGNEIMNWTTHEFYEDMDKVDCTHYIQCWKDEIKTNNQWWAYRV